MEYPYRYILYRRMNRVVQRYQLRKRLKEISNLFIVLVIVWFVGGTLTILSQWAFSAEIHNSIYDYLQYYWIVFIEVTSGFDVGEEVKILNNTSMAITVVMLIAGMVIGGLVSGEIIAIILNASKKAGFIPEAPSNFKFIDPIIIYGINEHIHGIISSLRNLDGIYRDILVIDKDADTVHIIDEKVYVNVWHIKVNTAKKNYLKEIFSNNLSRELQYSSTNRLFKKSLKSCRVIILPDQTKENDAFTDPDTIQKAMEIETFKRDIYTIVELYSDDVKKYLHQKNIEEWLNISDYSTRLIAQSALRPGLTTVFNEIMGGGSKGDIDDFNEMVGSIENIRLSLIPEQLSNQSYKEISKKLYSQYESPYTLIGFCKYLSKEEKGKDLLRNPDYYYQVNPPSIEKQDNFIKNYDSRSVRFNSQTILNKGHDNDLLIFLSSKDINLNHFT